MANKVRGQVRRRVLVLLAGSMMMSLLGAGMERRVAAEASASCPGERFSDVCPADWFYPYVLDLHDLGALSGYADGTFRPYNRVTRGQAMKLIVTVAALDRPLPGTNTFADVSATNPFHRWVEIGAALDVAAGYDCGSRPGEECDAQSRPYFRPAADVTRGQISKMMAIALGWAPLAPPTPTFMDVSPSNPFFGYVERAAAHAVVGGYDDNTFRPFNPLTRAQAGKMLSLARRVAPAPTVTGTPPTATPTRPATATRTATAQPSATATGASGGPQIAGCPLFPANNIWNRNIAGLPVHPRSSAYMAAIGLSEDLHPDFGAGLWEGQPIGIPYNVVPGNQPGVNVTFRYAPESDPAPYPIPPNPEIEGGPDSSGDRHILIVDRDNCVLHEIFDAHPNGDGSWQAGSGARWSLRSNALRPAGWTSADAAGLAMVPGLARYEEVATGVIRHALRFTAPRTQRAYIWPARHFASSLTDPNLPPMGLRVRLKAGVNIGGYSLQTRVVLQALKDYGMILSDNGSPWYVSGVPDERWNNNALVNEMREITGTDFEAVDTSGLIVDPNSGESR